jgi:hypothetical protein
MLVAQVPCDINMSSEYPSVLDSSQENPVNMLGEQGSPPRSDNSSSEGSNTLMSSKMHKDDCDVAQSIRLDISFKSPSHTGLQTTELVNQKPTINLNILNTIISSFLLLLISFLRSLITSLVVLYNYLQFIVTEN